MNRDNEENAPDLLDRAAALTQRLGDAAIERVRRMAAQEQARNSDGSWTQTDCEDCGEKIEPPRLALGKIRCISCQTELERRQRLGLPR